MWGAIAVCAVGSVPVCVVLAARGGIAGGLAILAAGFVCAGLSIFLFYRCREATRGVWALTKKITIGIKNGLIRKEERQ